MKFKIIVFALIIAAMLIISSCVNHDGYMTRIQGIWIANWCDKPVNVEFIYSDEDMPFDFGKCELLYSSHGMPRDYPLNEPGGFLLAGGTSAHKDDQLPWSISVDCMSSKAVKVSTISPNFKMIITYADGRVEEVDRDTFFIYSQVEEADKTDITNALFFTAQYDICPEKLLEIQQSAVKNDEE